MTGHRQGTEPSEGPSEATTLPWHWTKEKLYDANGAVIASLGRGVLTVDGEYILIETRQRLWSFQVRGTTSTGQSFTANKDSVTVKLLSMDCESRHYQAPRLRSQSQARLISNSKDEPVAYTEPQGPGELVVYQNSDCAAVPTRDLAFITWVCVLIDAPSQFKL